jgi:hypothetical protein
MNNAQVATAFANHNEGRTQERPGLEGGRVVSLTSTGDKLFSYNTVIAQHVTLAHGPATLVNVTPYSNTTARHVSHTRSALRKAAIEQSKAAGKAVGVPVIEVAGVPVGAWDLLPAAGNSGIEYHNSQVDRYADAASRTRRTEAAESYFQQAFEHECQAQLLRKLTGNKTKVRHAAQAFGLTGRQ